MENANDILFFGDTHGGFEHCLSIVECYKPKAIIFLGDLQASAPLHLVLKDVVPLTQIWWIHGNHDTDSYDYYTHLFDSPLANYNLHGRVANIAGYNVAGLGGVFRGRIWDPQKEGWNYYAQQDYTEHLSPHLRFRNGVSLKQRSSIFPETYMALRKQRCDIFVAHEAPSCNRFGFFAMDRLTQAMGAKKYFHGHHHDTYDYSAHFQRMGFEAFAVGFRGVTNLAGSCIRAGDMDGQFDNRVANRP